VSRLLSVRFVESSLVGEGVDIVTSSFHKTFQDLKEVLYSQMLGFI